ncbi:MAG TPA: rod shape-determining protein MreD [Candidatus Nanopelagicaceae bacterium]|nr:rod shape-determining protein MreD [Candidatus Nanopelagicaceae bacterium]
MRGSRELSALIALLFAYVLQTSVIARLQLPLGGPNLVLILFLAWALQHEALHGALIGFTVGMLMDLAPPAISTVGAWTLVLTVVGYGISSLATRSQNLGNSPITDWLLCAVGLLAIFFGRIVVGAAVGEPEASLSALMDILAGLVTWNLLLAPFAIWLSRRLFSSLSPSAEMMR